jgi:hypothetical protein
LGAKGGGEFKRFYFHCYGWELIATHFHLFLKTGKKSIAKITRRLLTRKQKNGEALLKKRKYSGG